MACAEETIATLQGEVFAAEGWGKCTGEVGVCIATSGPGATNLVTGLADALLDSVPVVAITGQVPRPMIGTDAFQETPIVEITRQVRAQLCAWKTHILCTCICPHGQGSVCLQRGRLQVAQQLLAAVESLLAMSCTVSLYQCGCIQIPRHGLAASC